MLLPHLLPSLDCHLLLFLCVFADGCDLLQLVQGSTPLALDIHLLPNLLQAKKLALLLLRCHPLLRFVLPDLCDDEVLFFTQSDLVFPVQELLISKGLSKHAIFLQDLRLPLLHLGVAFSRKRLRMLFLNGSDLCCRPLLHLPPLTRSVLLTAHSSVLSILLLDQSSDGLGLLLLHQHLQLGHGALLRFLGGLMSFSPLMLLLLDLLKLRKSRFSVFIGFLQSLRGLELLEVALGMQLGNEPLSGTFAFD
mmetsp:Transcript_48211/g.90247  ORF Transcript_48211/g.90247 Transcript_48211/m.90247 type:complete len:250 (+) Transcript_48211:21-770(+)